MAQDCSFSRRCESGLLLKSVVLLVLALQVACAGGPPQGGVWKAQRWEFGPVFPEGGGGGGGSSSDDMDAQLVWLRFIGRKEEELRQWPRDRAPPSL